MALLLDASRAMDTLDRMPPIFHEAAIPLATSLKLARRFDLSAGDANELAFALELRLPNACTNGTLRTPLRRAGVKLAGYPAFGSSLRWHGGRG
jgi:hypothetical protein